MNCNQNYLGMNNLGKIQEVNCLFTLKFRRKTLKPVQNNLTNYNTNKLSYIIQNIPYLFNDDTLIME